MDEQEPVPQERECLIMAKLRSKAFTVAELADRWNLSASQVRTLIREKQLAAIDISTGNTARPTYRVMPKDVYAFETRCKVRKAPTRQYINTSDGVTEEQIAKLPKRPRRGLRDLSFLS